MPSKIRDFLNQYGSPSTKNSYRSAIIAYFTFVYDFRREGKRISDAELSTLELMADRYFTEKRNYEQDLIAFDHYCEEKLAPSSKSFYQSAMREFLLFNDIDFTSKQQKNLRNKIERGDPTSFEAEFSKELMLKILNTADLRMKTLILVLLTSGMRLGEALKLTTDTIEVYEDHTLIKLRKTKKNSRIRFTFCNKEATTLLKQWLEYRPKYIAENEKRSRGKFISSTHSNRIFPFSKNSCENSMKRMLVRNELWKQDNETGRADIHFHLFRKFFVQNLHYSGMEYKFIDYLVGHISKVDIAYDSQTIARYYSVYQKGEPYLRIFDDSIEETTNLREETIQLKDMNRDLRIDNIELKQELSEMKRIGNEFAQIKAQLIMRKIIENPDHSL